MLSHEKLDVYRCSIDHLAIVYKQLSQFPKGFSALADQWRRAATSIPLNIAEANGKATPPDRASRFIIARGEATECGAVLDVLKILSICVQTSSTAPRRSWCEWSRC